MGYLDSVGVGVDDYIPSWNDVLAGKRKPKLTYEPLNIPQPLFSSGLASGPQFDSTFTQGQFTQAQGLNEQLDALDIARDAGGKAAGFASGVLDWVDNTRASAMGFVSGGLNVAGNMLENVGVENPLDEWTDMPDQADDEMANPFERAWKGATNQENYGAGDFDGPLKMDDDDPLWLKALKGTGAFVTDVGLDPLTYLSFGAASVGKKIATEVVDKAAKEFAKDLSEEATTSLASRHWTRNLKDTAGIDEDDIAKNLVTDPDAPLLTKGRVVHAADRDNYGYIVEPGETKSTVFFRSPDGVEATKELDNTLLTKASASAADRFAKQMGKGVDDATAATQVFGSEAAEAYTRGGAQGLKRWVDNSTELTYEQKKALWESLPRDVRGGLRVRIPLVRSNKEPITFGVGTGGGELAAKIGLGGVLEKANAARFATRSSKPVRTLTGKITGETGNQYNEVLRGLRTGEANRTTYGIYSTLKDASRNERMLLAASGRETIERLTEVTAELEAEGVDKARATARMTELFNDRASATALKADDAVDATEAAAIRGAQVMHQMFDDWKVKAEAEGLDMGEVSNFVTRVMLDEAKAKKGRLAKANLRGSATQNPTKGRSGFGTRMVWDGEKLTVQARPVTDINAERIANGEEAIFSEDPFSIMLSYGKAMNRLIATKRLENVLTDNGLVAMVPKAPVKNVDVYAVRDLSRTAKKQWADYLEIVGKRKGSLASRVESVERQLVKAREELAQMRRPDRQEPLWTDETLADEDFLSGLNAYIDRISPNATPEQRQAVIDAQLLAREFKNKEDAVLRKIGALEQELSGYTKDLSAIEDAVAQSILNEGKLTDLVRSMDQMTETEALKTVDALMDWLTSVYGEQKTLLRRLDIPEDKAGKNPADGLILTVTREQDDLVKALDAAGYGRLGTDDTGRKVTLPGGKQFDFDEYWATEGVRLFVGDWFNKTSDTGLNRMLDTYYAPVYSLWKTYATVGRGPGYLVRNIVGGLWNNHLIDATPRDHKLSGKLAREVSKARKAARETHPDNLAAQQEMIRDLLTGPDGSLTKVKVSRGATLADVYRVMQDQDLYQTTSRLEYLSVDTARAGEDALDVAFRDGTGRKLVDGDGRVARAANFANSNVWTDNMSKLAQQSEEWLRGAAVIAGIRRYGMIGDGQPAGLLAKVAHFDYGDLSQFERRVMRNIMPFYTWSRNNIPLQLRALINEPGKAMNLVRFQETLKDVFGTEEDGIDGISWEEMMPAYFRNKFGFVTGMDTPGGPLVLGLESPLTDLNTFLPSPTDPTGIFGKTQTTFVDSLNPFIKTGVSLVTGTDASTGAPLRQQGQQAPSWARALENVPGLGDWLINYDQKGDGTVEKNIDNWIGLPARDWIPPLGILERVVLPAVESGAEAATGRDLELATPEYKDRQASSTLSFFGAPVFTATEGQIGGTLADSNETKNKVLEDFLGKNNIDKAKFREAVKLQQRLGKDDAWLWALIESGRLAPDPQ